MKDLANSFWLNPDMNFSQVNERLHYIGWNDIELDYHTFQLAKECLGTDNPNESGTRQPTTQNPAPSNNEAGHWPTRQFVITTCIYDFIMLSSIFSNT